MFSDKDLKNLQNLMEAIATKVKLHDLDCMDISKVYNSFEWLQNLEEKISKSMAMKHDLDNMEVILNQQEERYGAHIKELEVELEELKAPKKKAPKKKAVKKKAK